MLAGPVGTREGVSLPLSWPPPPPPPIIKSWLRQWSNHSALAEKGSQAAISAWKPLCARKSPTASWGKRSIQRASKFMRMSMTKRRTATSIAESATKELKSLAEFSRGSPLGDFLAYCCLTSLSRQATSDLTMGVPRGGAGGAMAPPFRSQWRPPPCRRPLLLNYLTRSPYAHGIETKIEWC